MTDFIKQAFEKEPTGVFEAQRIVVDVGIAVPALQIGDGGIIVEDRGCRRELGPVGFPTFATGIKAHTLF